MSIIGVSIIGSVYYRGFMISGIYYRSEHIRGVFDIRFLLSVSIIE